MGKLFGTDGVRGVAGKDLTCELALQIGRGTAAVLTQLDGHRPKILIGKDTRVSGDMLESTLAAGLCSVGASVVLLGVVPTPAVAYLTGAEDVDLAVMISASHNPMADNGIKFFTRGGVKLDDAIEDAIEADLATDWALPTGGDVGTVTQNRGEAGDRYVQHLLGTTDVDLTGLRIAVDCANGAASEVGPAALRAAGADVVVINASPDGRNINEQCGSTHPEQLQAVTVASGADLGVAYDGDADRCLAVDHTGALVDGDQIMGILAVGLNEAGQLAGSTLVVTVMSNLGLLLAMQEAGIAVVQTGVGDRYVLEAMRAGGHSLGGEQSGHIVMAEHATTGDGVLTSLQLAARVAATGRRLADLAAVMTRLPQVLVNVPGVDKSRVDSDEQLAAAVAAAEQRLGTSGRVLLRSSGTEPLVRVMVEAASEDQAEREAEALGDVVRERLALA